MVKKVLRTTIAVASIVIVAMAGATVYKTFFQNEVAAASFTYTETWTATEAVYTGKLSYDTVWNKGALPTSGAKVGYSNEAAAIAISKWTVSGTVNQ